MRQDISLGKGRYVWYDVRVEMFLVSTAISVWLGREQPFERVEQRWTSTLKPGPDSRHKRVQIVSNLLLYL